METSKVPATRSGRPQVADSFVTFPAYEQTGSQVPGRIYRPNRNWLLFGCGIFVRLEPRGCPRMPDGILGAGAGMASAKLGAILQKRYLSTFSLKRSVRKSRPFLTRNRVFAGLVAGLALVTALGAVQRTALQPFREYPGDEYRVAQIPLPPD